MGTLTILKAVTTFALKLELAIPPENPQVRGYLTFDCKVKTKPEIKELQDRNLSDQEYFAEIVTAVHGAPNPSDPNGSDLEGDAALKFVTDGPYSMWILPAFITAYFEQYGDARRKNGQRLPRR